MPGTPEHLVWSATIPDLKPGEDLKYWVFSGSKERFTASTHAPKSPSQPVRFAVYGDTGRNTKGQREVAFQISRTAPDFAVVTGDIVYPNGRISEYRKNWFPIMNSDKKDLASGAPLLRSILHVGVAGNHDTAYRSLSNYPDGLAYYLYWLQPSGGPDIDVKTSGPDASRKALFEGSERRLNSRANFAFAYGDAYWIALDANTYANWSSAKLKGWLEGELKKAQKYTWKFVTFHQPPYHSSKKHQSDTMMRSSHDLFVRYGVDVVFCGHVHNYQRTVPMGIGAKLDRAFDGAKQTRPNGVIYVVTGAGGAELYDQMMADQPKTWQPWTAVYKAGYSFTLCDLDRKQLTIRQVSDKGNTLDQFVIQK